MQTQSTRWWFNTAALTVALGASTLSPGTLLPQAQAQKKAETAIPVSTGKNLTTYQPTAAEVLTPPDNFTGDIKIAGTAPVIDFGILPGQTQPAELWSNWGDSAFANGKFYASIGDHDAPYGVALVYEVDPAAKTMKPVVNINEVGNYTDKTKYSPGKVHSPLMDGGDGWLYFFGYRGSESKTTAELGYVGDPLIRYNPVTGATENLGPVIPHNSVAASEIHIPSRTVYVLGNHGRSAVEKRDQFYAYNLDTRQMIFSGGPEPLMARAMMVAADGRVYYSVAKPGSGRVSTDRKDKGEPPTGILSKYDPKTNQITLTDIEVPGDGIVRAASRANAEGVIYSFSKNGVIFAFDTKTEQLKEITTATFAGSGYTAVSKLDPTGRYLYYVPSAHGGSVAHGSAIFQLDTQTGQRKVLAFLNDYFRGQLNYNLGGTFGIALNDDGSQLFICWNGRPIGGKNDDFGQTAVMTVHIPESERSTL